MKYYHPDTDFARKLGIAPPKAYPHGNAEEIRAKLKRANFKSWRLEGNRLIGDSDLGPVTQIIPTDYICHGMDSEGLPILKKVVL